MKPVSLLTATAFFTIGYFNTGKYITGLIGVILAWVLVEGTVYLYNKHKETT